MTWTDEFNSSLTETGFERVPGGAEYANRSVFSFHFYEPPLGPNAGDADDYFSERTLDAIRWNTTGFLTEFDISNENSTQAQFAAMSKTMDLCDKYMVSWAGWEYKPFAGALEDGTCTGCPPCLFLNNGSANHYVRKALSRTYAQRVAGHATKVEFDSDWKTGGRFELEFEMDTAIQAPTIIYVNEQYWYPNGYNLSLTPQNAQIVDYKREKSYVEVYNSDDKQYDGQKVTVSIIPVE